MGIWRIGSAIRMCKIGWLITNTAALRCFKLFRLSLTLRVRSRSVEFWVTFFRCIQATFLPGGSASCYNLRITSVKPLFLSLTLFSGRHVAGLIYRFAMLTFQTRETKQRLRLADFSVDVKVKELTRQRTLYNSKIHPLSKNCI